MNAHSIASLLTGEDFRAMGLIAQPTPGVRTPGSPVYALHTRHVETFLLYWGFSYDSNYSPIPLKQEIRTGQTYGLISRDSTGRAVIINGIYIVFYAEALHSSCRVADITVFNGEDCLGTLRTQDHREAMEFAKKLRPDWEAFIGQSVLFSVQGIMNRSDPARGANIHRRLFEVTQKQSGSTEVVDLDICAEPPPFEDETPDTPSPDFELDPSILLPNWPSDPQFISFSDEILSPPTREDRPMLAQLMLTTLDGFPIGDSTGTIRPEIKRHVSYWLTTQRHRVDDNHGIAPCECGVEIRLGLKITANAGIDKLNRQNWLENAFQALKLQIEQGTAPKKNGEITCPRVSVVVSKIRCAYP